MKNNKQKLHIYKLQSSAQISFLNLFSKISIKCYSLSHSISQLLAVLLVIKDSLNLVQISWCEELLKLTQTKLTLHVLLTLRINESHSLESIFIVIELLRLVDRGVLLLQELLLSNNT